MLSLPSAISTDGLLVPVYNPLASPVSVVGAIIASIALAGFIVSVVLSTEGVSVRKLFRTAVALLVIGVSCLVPAIVTLSHPDPRIATVQSWATSRYGIELSPKSVGVLLSADNPFIYEPRTVHLVEGTDIAMIESGDGRSYLVYDHEDDQPEVELPLVHLG